MTAMLTNDTEEIQITTQEMTAVIRTIKRRRKWQRLLNIFARRRHPKRNRWKKHVPLAPPMEPLPIWHHPLYSWSARYRAETRELRALLRGNPQTEEIPIL